MSEASYDPEAFREFERAGWNGAAAAYADLFGAVTAQAAVPLLDAAGARFGTRLLDLACGTGAVAAGALMRGCDVVGADFAAEMVAEAARRWPGAEFRRCDAEALPFPDARFEAVVSNFGFIHFPRPEIALAEAARALEPGGALAFTAWTSDAGHRSLMERAIREQGDPDVPLVAGPPAPFYEDKAECARAMAGAGFAAPEFSDLALYMEAASAGGVLEVIEKSTVRSAARLAAQTPEARARIREAIIRGAGAFEREGAIRLPMRARLISARKLQERA